ncbi:MAG: hypothetical protein KGI72_05910 [Patescibacteria group bacterium]|nr:hypothetical protein [Patescibacteria group bacterium]
MNPDSPTPIQALYPLPFVFRYRQSGNRNPAAAAIDPIVIYETCRVSYPKQGGIEMWFTDCPYPAKGFPYPEALMMINGVKRLWIGLLRGFSRDCWLIALAFLFSPSRGKIVDRFIFALADAGKRMTAHCALYPKRCTPVVRELWSIAYLLLREGLGVSEKTAKDFAEVLMMMLEYDDAYRKRLQDLLSASSKQKLLKNPAREIKRLLVLLYSRTLKTPESLPVADKYRAVAALFFFLWALSARWRRAWRKAVGQCDFPRLRFDRADIYHLLLQADYDYFGKNIDERARLWESYHKRNPPFPKRIKVIPI